jgi:hypothetical protein
MKIFICLIAFLLFSGFAPDVAEPFKITLPLILSFIVALYEVVIRLIPTVGQWGLIGKIIEILAWLSNFLNRKK